MRLAIKKILHLHRLGIFFCCETKMWAKRVNLEGSYFNFANCFVVDKNGLGGGLALFWGSNVEVEIKSYNSHHIDAVVKNGNGKV